MVSSTWCVKQEKIDRLVTMHASIARGDVNIKSLPLFLSALGRWLRKKMMTKIAYEKNLLQRKQEGVYKLRRHCLSYRWVCKS